MTRRKPPWWQLTRKPTWGFVLGALWVVIAAGQWWRLASGVRDDSWTALTVILPVLSTLVAVAYVASALRLRRSVHRAPADGGTDVPPS